MITDKILLDKYNKPVPRYTSYPPANYFTDGFLASDFEAAIAESNTKQPENISFYIHIPFCKRMCFYCGCNMCLLRKEDEVKAYIDAVKKEIELVTSKLDKGRKVSQIHYGGGTPNSIPVEYLQELNALLFEKFDFIEQPEIAIECSPAYLDLAYIDGLKKAGFNRFSLGIQDFNLDVLKTVNREPAAMPVDEIIAAFKNGNPDIAVNLDFIYGLPGQTVESFTKTIEQAISYQPDRLVTFSYAHVPWVNKAQMALEKAGLPSSDVKLQLFETAYQLLAENDYKMIGFDHYAKANDELSIALDKKALHRNFQGYCTRRTTGQVYAFGVSSISQLENVYAQNTKDIAEYIQIISEGKLPIIKGYQLKQNEIIAREVINQLMCNGQVHFSGLEQILQVTKQTILEAINYDEKVLKEFEAEALLSMNENGFEVPQEALLFMRNIAASLDPLMVKNTKSFSKSV